MYVLLMTFSEDAQAQAALATLATAGVGPISVIPGFGFSGDGRRRQCLHAFCIIGAETPAHEVCTLLARTVGPPAGPFGRWAVLPALEGIASALVPAGAASA